MHGVIDSTKEYQFLYGKECEVTFVNEKTQIPFNACGSFLRHDEGDFQEEMDRNPDDVHFQISLPWACDDKPKPC